MMKLLVLLVINRIIKPKKIRCKSDLILLCKLSNKNNNVDLLKDLKMEMTSLNIAKKILNPKIMAV